ncbi:DUF6055 domain-containing protein [Cellulomonas sp. URHB0016]
MGRIRRGTLVAALLVPVVVAVLVVTTLSRADDRTKDVVVPTAWSAVWQRSHTLEGDDVVLAWGDLAGEDPRNAPSELRFDPAATVADLDALYAADVRELQVADERGAAGRHKLVVLADGTWSGSVPDAPAIVTLGGVASRERTAVGTVDDGVGLVRAQVSAMRGVPNASWDLAHGVAETVLEFAATEGEGAADPGDAFRAASAAFLATATSDTGIGDPSDLVRSPSLPWSSARTGDGGWLLLQYLADREGSDLLGRLWRGARDGESPVETYRRLAKIDQASLNRRVAEYALRTVTWDYTHQAQILDAVSRLDPVLLAGRSTPVTAVPDDPGHYQVLDGFAPSDYGFNLVRLTPDAPMSTIHVRLKGHVGSPDAGWSLGVVALRNGVPRYSPVVEGQDEEVQFTLRDGETEAYLVVVGTPSVTHRLSGGAPFGATPRYPYEFRVAGATVSEHGTAGAVAGGHLHANGGGWVDDDATVDDTAYVGPYAVVRGGAQVLGSARVEGAAWVDGGAVLDGQAVVRDMAVVHDGARLGGTVVVGGDAVVDFTCTAGTYAAFSTDRGCDGLAGPPDVNLPVAPFGAADLAFGEPTALSVDPPGPTDPSVATPDATATTGGSPDPAGSTDPGGTSTSTGSPSTDPVVPATPSPTSGVVDPPEPVPAGACSATYVVTNTWPANDGATSFQAQLEVTAGSSGVEGWAVSWPLPSGQQVTAVWNAQLGTSGSTVTAENMSYNGTLRPGEKAVFGLQGTSPAGVARNVPQLTCTRTR